MNTAVLLLLAAVPAAAEVLYVQDLNTRQFRELDRARTARRAEGRI